MQKLKSPLLELWLTVLYMKQITSRYFMKKENNSRNEYLSCVVKQTLY